MDSFCSVLKRELKDRSSGLGKGYLRLLVDEIRVEGKEVVIKGKCSPIAGMIAETKAGAHERAPTFVVDWLPGMESCKNFSATLFIKVKQMVDAELANTNGESARLTRFA